MSFPWLTRKPPPLQPTRGLPVGYTRGVPVMGDSRATRGLPIEYSWDTHGRLMGYPATMGNL